jgi:hypothetical protein
MIFIDWMLSFWLVFGPGLVDEMPSNTKFHPPNHAQP